MAATACANHGTSLPTGRPEDAGLSSAGLRRIHDTVQRYIDARQITGAVTLVARRGRIVHFEVHGLMDVEFRTPMRKDALFRLASMTKPVTAVAVLDADGGGKLRLAIRSPGSCRSSGR